MTDAQAVAPATADPTPSEMLRFRVGVRTEARLLEESNPALAAALNEVVDDDSSLELFARAIKHSIAVS